MRKPNSWNAIARLAGQTLLLSLVVGGCAERHVAEEPRPAKAGEAIDPLETAIRLAKARGAAVTGDQAAVQAEMGAIGDDIRKSIKLADPARAVDRESARQAARTVAGVRSVAWVDRENLFVIVDANEARSYQTIDRICLALEPLGDTLGVVVNLQSGVAVTGDELAIVSRNCQLAPGDHAFLSKHRKLDVVAPAVRDQHRANQSLSEQSEEDLERQRESLRILEATTPSVHD